MAKRLVAVTEIRTGDKVIPAGEPVEASQFEKSQLEQLYDAGAIAVEDSSQDPNRTAEEEAAKVEKMRAEADKANREEAQNDKQQQLHAENMHISADQSAAASSPAGEPKPTAKSAPAQAVKETSNVKGNAK